MQVNAETAKCCPRRLSQHNTELILFADLVVKKTKTEVSSRKESVKMVEAKRRGNEIEIPEKSSGKPIEHRRNNNRECGRMMGRNC